MKLTTRLPKSYCVHCLLPVIRGATSHGHCTERIHSLRRNHAHVEAQYQLGREVGAVVAQAIVARGRAS